MNVVGTYELPVNEKPTVVRPHETDFFYERAFPWLFPYGVGGPDSLGSPDSVRSSTASRVKFARHVLQLRSRSTVATMSCILLHRIFFLAPQYDWRDCDARGKEHLRHSV